MANDHTISFKVTPAQKETIEMRMRENGFDDLSSYLKVSALRIQEFNHTSAGAPKEEPTIELSFSVTQAQKESIEAKVKESGCEDMTTYLQYVTQHAVVTAVIEVRSTGNLDAMLKRIAQSRDNEQLKKLF